MVFKPSYLNSLSSLFRQTVLWEVLIRLQHLRTMTIEGTSLPSDKVHDILSL